MSHAQHFDSMQFFMNFSFAVQESTKQIKILFSYNLQKSTQIKLSIFLWEQNYKAIMSFNLFALSISISG